MGGRGAEGANRTPGVHTAKDDASLGPAGRSQGPVDDNARWGVRFADGVEQLLESPRSSTKAGASRDATTQSLENGARPITISTPGDQDRKTSPGHQPRQRQAVSLAQREHFPAKGIVGRSNDGSVDQENPNPQGRVVGPKEKGRKSTKAPRRDARQLHEPLSADDPGSKNRPSEDRCFRPPGPWSWLAAGLPTD